MAPSRRAMAIIAIAVLAATAGCLGAIDDAGDTEPTIGEQTRDAPADSVDVSDDPPDDVADDSGVSTEADVDESLDDDGTYTSTAMPDEDDTASDGGFDGAPAVERDLIRTAVVHTEVEDFDVAESTLRTEVSIQGGYLAETEVTTHGENNETWRTGTLEFRVPSEGYDDFLAEAEDVGEVQDARTSTEDVTDQLVDIEARLDNLEAERDRLQALFEEANDTEDVLMVQRELSSVQEEIERLEAQHASLEDRVAYSTVTVHLEEPEPETEPEPEDPAWYEQGLGEAFMSSVNDLLLAGRAAVVAAAMAAPYAMVGAVPLVAVGALGGVAVRRFRSN